MTTLMTDRRTTDALSGKMPLVGFFFQREHRGGVYCIEVVLGVLKQILQKKRVNLGLAKVANSLRTPDGAT